MFAHYHKRIFGLIVGITMFFSVGIHQVYAVDEVPPGPTTDQPSNEQALADQITSDPIGNLVGKDSVEAALQQIEADSAAAAQETQKESEQNAAAGQQFDTASNDFANTEIGNSDALLEDLSCGITSLTECPPIWAYYVFFIPSSFILSLVSQLFDFSLTLSLDSGYLNPTFGKAVSFIDTGWAAVRDIANMAFIFILLYTGISTILGLGNWKRTIGLVVIVALLINFSLFFTRVVIDAGNVLAIGVYQALAPVSTTHKKISTSNIDEREVSSSLVEAFQPQNFTKNISGVTTFNALVIFLVATVINIAVAFTLFKVTLVFIGRLFAFWVLMILSPIAFIAAVVPKGYEKIFAPWIHNLVSQAFVAPVFLFCLYLIMTVIQSGMFDAFKVAGEGVSGFLATRLFFPAVGAIILIMAISKAGDLAKKMSGVFGELGSKVGGTMLGFAGGLALGGAAGLGRATIGAGANRLAESGMLKGLANREGSLGQIGRAGLRVAGAARTSSLDIRGTGLFQTGAAKTGLTYTGQAGGQGGFAANAERKIQELEQQKQRREISQKETEALGARARTEAIQEFQQGNANTENAHRDAQTASKKAAEAVAAQQDKVREAKNRTSADVNRAQSAYDMAVGGYTSGKPGVSRAQVDGARIALDTAKGAQEQAVYEAEKALQEATRGQNNAAKVEEGTAKAMKKMNDLLADQAKVAEHIASNATRRQAELVRTENNQRTQGFVNNVASGKIGNLRGLSEDQRNAALDRLRNGPTEGSSRQQILIQEELARQNATLNPMQPPVNPLGPRAQSPAGSVAGIPNQPAATPGVAPTPLQRVV